MYNIYKNVKRVLLAILLLLSTQICWAQTFPYPTDTLRNTVQACDSFYDSRTDSIYRANTIIEYAQTKVITNPETAESDTVIDSLFISTLTIGKSYQYKDTVTVSVCSNSLPYLYAGQSFTTSGDYEIPILTGAGCDSIHRLLHFNLFPTVRDTISLAACANDFPIQYNNLRFKDSGTFSQSLANDLNGCPIITSFIITKHRVYADTVISTICVTDTPYTALDTSFTASTIYQKNYTTQNGCDSICTLLLTVNPAYTLTDTLHATICSADRPYLVGDSSFYEAGIFDFPLHTVAGCDSIAIHLELSIHETHYDTVAYTLCHNDFPFIYNEIDYPEAGQYEIVHDDLLECHDITRLILKELPSYLDTVNVTLCANELPYLFADSNFTASAVFTHIDTTTLGCDSLTTLHLVVNQSYLVYDTLDMAICQNKLPYSFADSLLQEAGNYDFELPTVTGCDSAFIHLRFSILENPYDTVAMAICTNKFPYLYQDTLLDTTGTYDLVLSDRLGLGCDTLRHLIIASLPVYHDSVSVMICANSSYTIGDSILQAPGIYDIPLLSVNGCDSIVTVTVGHYPIYQSDTVRYRLCETELPFVFADSSFTESGLHQVLLETVNGCDSLISFNLQIMPTLYNRDTIRREICANELPYTAFDSSLTEAGIYIYTTTSVSTGCDSVFYLRLIVHDNPVMEISGNDYLCRGTTSHLSVTPTLSSYHWNNGFTDQMLTINIAGTYSVTGTNEYGCRSAASLTVTEASLPEITFSGSQELCLGGSTTITAAGGTHYTWDNGLSTASISVTPSTTTTYHVTVTNDTPCSSYGQIEVTVHSLPVVSITGLTAICQEESTSFLATGGISYVWSTGATEDNITVSTAGNYSVTVTDENGCAKAGHQILTVFPKPTIRINGRSEFCQGSTTILTASGAKFYEWNSGETTASITTGIIGSYTVTGTSSEGCSSTATQQINIMQISAGISGNRAFCQGSSTTLTVSSANSYTYKWYDGSTSQSVTVSAAGTYSVTVTNALGCSNTISTNITEYALPTPTISGNLTVCEGRSTILRAGGGISYQWDDGSTRTYLSASATGTYAVTVTNQNGCSASTSATVIVNDLPDINIMTTANICYGDNVSIYAICPTGTSYAWASGQSTSLISVNPTATTTYTVLVTDENNCSGTATTTITVNPLPIAYIGGVSDICRGDTAMLTAYGGNTYQWNNGQTTNSIKVANAGTFTVTVTGTSGCSASKSTTLTINALPAITISENQDICQGQTATLTVSGNSGNTYKWSNGSSQTGISVGTAGTYTVTATNVSGCSSTASVAVSVKAKPTVVISGKAQFCIGSTTVLTAGSDSFCQFTWNNGTQNAQINLSEAGTYTVTATNTSGCSSSASVVVTLNSLPTPTITGNNAICPHGTTVLTTGSASHYRWSTGDTTQSIIVSPSSATSYMVTVTNEYGCVGSTSNTVTINTPPTIQITGDLNLCEGESTALQVTSGYQYLWSGNQTESAITVREAGTYTVTATNAAGCITTASATVIVHALPDFTIGGKKQICNGETTTLTATSTENCLYLWNNGIQAASTEISVAGTYTVTATNIAGCNSTATAVVIVNALPTPTITGTNTICPNGVASLTANVASHYHWSTGDTTQTILVYPTAVSSYYVTVTNEYGCVASTSGTVSINATPAIQITGDLTLCEGESTSLQVTSGYDYTWSNNATTTLITITEAGTYTVTATNAAGCHSTASATVMVNTKPDLTITGSTRICAGKTAKLTAFSSNNCIYAWSNGSQADTTTISASGTYTVTATNASGCTNTKTVTVDEKALPVPIITGNNHICPNSTTALTVSAASHYYWSTGDTTQTIMVSPTTLSSYYVTVTNEYGCVASTSGVVNINATPAIQITGDLTLCEGESTSLQVTSGYDYTWSNNASTSLITTTEAGTYTVTATNAAGCHSTASATVIVNTRPDLTITGNTKICAGETTKLTAFSSDHCNYAWSNESQADTTTLSASGTYAVTATNAVGCTSTKTVTIYENALPVPIITGNNHICPNNSTALTVSAASHYYWSTGDTTQTIIVSPTTLSSYFVTVTDENGCTGSTANTVSINSIPVIQISGKLVLCEGESTSLQVTSGYRYRWSDNDTTATITVHEAGTYTVTATNTAGCNSTATVTVTVHTLPSLSFGGQHSICAGETYTYTLPADTAVTYLWSNSATSHTITVSTSNSYTVTVTNQYGCSRSATDILTVNPLPTPSISGNTSICQSSYSILTATGGSSYVWSEGSHTGDIAVYPTANTTYSVTATNEYGCSASASTTVTLKVLPAISFNGSQSFCSGGSTAITVSGGISYVWSTGSTSPSITFNAAGTYYVTATNSLGCQSKRSIVISEFPNPSISISGVDFLCTGNTGTLTVTGGSTYSWSTGEQNSVINVMPTGTTTYTVTGFNTSGCSSTVSRVINVEALPNVQISGILTICQGETTTLAASNGNSYVWSTGSTSDTIQVINGGNYAVTATSLTGCSATTSATVIINPTPTAGINGNITLCSNERETLTATGGSSYRWNTGETSANIVISESGLYQVTTTNDYGCSSTADIQITALSAPFLDLIGDNTLCQGETTQLTASSNAIHFIWNTNDTLQAISVTPNATTVYQVSATGQNGCQETDSLTVKVNPVYSHNIAAAICQGTTYSANGFNLPAQDTAGTFIYDNILQSVNGCDSIIHLILTVKPLPVLPDTITGTTHIITYNPYHYAVVGASYVDDYEWRISNTNWNLNDSGINTVFLTVNSNGSGILTAKAINSCGYKETSISIYCNVGVEEYSNETNILLYPNPVSNTLMINFENADISIAQIQLFDNLGRQLQAISVHNSPQSLDCSNYAAGVYYVRFTDDKGKIIDTRKIIIHQ